MTKINLFTNILILLTVIIICAISQCSSKLSDKRLCYDPECSEPVSLGKTLITYNPKDPELLSFDINVKVKIFSKEAGTRKDIWGVEINGKRGYAPKTFIKEYKILKRDLLHEVPTNVLPSNSYISDKNEIHSLEKNDDLNTIEKSEPQNIQIDASDLKATEEEKLSHTLDGISASYNIIDGTTIPLDQNEPSLEPSFVTKVVQASAVPSKQDVINVKPDSSSSSEIIVSTTSVKPDELIHEIAEAAGQKSEKTEIPNEIIVDNFITNTEELSDLPKIVGIEVPLVGVDTKLKKDVLESEINEADSVRAIDPLSQSDDLAKSDAKDTQPLATIAVDGTESAEFDHIKDDTDKNVPTIESDKQIPIDHSVETVVHNQTEADEESNGTQSVENDIVQLEKNEIKEEVDEPISGIDSIEASSNKSDSNVLIESEIKEADKVVLPDTGVAEEQKIVPKSNLEEKIFSTEPTEEILVKDMEHEITDEPRSSDTIEEKILNVGSESDTVPLSSILYKSNINVVEKENVTDVSDKANIQQELPQESQVYTEKEIPTSAEDATIRNDTLETSTVKDTAETNETIVNINVNNKDNSDSTEAFNDSSEFFLPDNEKADLLSPKQLLFSSQDSIIPEHNYLNINEFHNRNLLNVENGEKNVEIKEDNLGAPPLTDKILPEDGGGISNEDNILHENIGLDDVAHVQETTPESILEEVQVSASDVCTIDDGCMSYENVKIDQDEDNREHEESATMEEIKLDRNHWSTLLYLTLTAVTTLVFSLGYYYIENMRRDGKLIAKINKLEKDLLISTKECTMMTENWKSAKDKLTSIEDKSFGFDEMVNSLKGDLEASQDIRAELEDHVTMLEKDLESATEAGLELERMLREVLSSNSEVNPLAQSVEDLQARLNAQQAANESLTNALNLKSQESENLMADFVQLKSKNEELDVELERVTENLKFEVERKNNMEKTLTDKVHRLEMKLKEISTEKTALLKELKNKEVEMKDLVEVINQLNSNNLDLDKLFDVSQIKADATSLLEERNELKIRLSEVEGAHNLLEEHTKLIKEEINILSEQCKVAEKEKKDAETRLEVLTNFFNEKETQRQKDEAVWLQKQGEVMSTVERIQTMQNEIQNYKQQVEMLKREILDQEREYKGQISLLETKAHEQWVVARQVERRLEESKTEAGQLRNRLTLIEKNINDVDSEAKLHRLEANGETATSPPLFLGAETSSSPIMFTGSSGVPPPPPPSYMHSLFHPYLLPPLPSTSGVPPFEVGQRPPPLGGRLSSPPPMPLHPPAPSRYDNAGSPPPPMSPHIFAPYNHRSPPPPFGGDHIHHPHPHAHPPPPPPGSILPPPLGTSNSWGEESLPPPRNSGFHPSQREQRLRNHKDSLHSSGESLDKTHHSSKV